MLCRLYRERLCGDGDEESPPPETSAAGSETEVEDDEWRNLWSRLVVHGDSWFDGALKLRMLLLTGSAALCGFSRAVLGSQSPFNRQVAYIRDLLPLPLPVLSVEKIPGLTN